MHEDESPYELVQPPQHVTLDRAVEALLLARWKDQSMVLVDGLVEWVRSSDVQVDWAPWSTAVAANA
ncbi:MAG: hypothetical protein JWP14_480 [Frankiales bacterium]|jgi:hypothetical protein|nr:hypothetical protein [Frankiales bacterium]